MAELTATQECQISGVTRFLNRIMVPGRPAQVGGIHHFTVEEMEGVRVESTVENGVTRTSIFYPNGKEHHSYVDANGRHTTRHVAPTSSDLRPGASDSGPGTWDDFVDLLRRRGFQHETGDEENRRFDRRTNRHCVPVSGIRTQGPAPV